MPEAEQSTPKAGECSCCFESRQKQGLPPRLLVDTNTTTCGFNPRKQKFPVRVCEACDYAPPAV